MTDTPAYLSYPDLASRDLAGSVVYANDELFAERENLIKPGDAVFAVEDFGNKGKVYDGWETKRRRTAGNDSAIVRLGVPGIVRGVDIDTTWFRGNYPPQGSIEGACVDDNPTVDELLVAEWIPLVERTDLQGDTHNRFEVTCAQRITHVRLSIFPDGGVSRLRVHGEPRPDPRLLTGTVDVAAIENGGYVVECSNEFYSSPLQVIQPGRARKMGDGWENARRRVPGNDHLTISLGAPCVLRRIELDTSYFVGNAPDRVSLTLSERESGASVVVADEVSVQADTRHFFRLRDQSPATALRVDVFPDGGIARVRAHGEIPQESLRQLAVRWLEESPRAARLAALRGAGLGEEEAGRAIETDGWDDAVIGALLA